MRISKFVAGVALAGVATFGGFSMATPALATGGSGGGSSSPALVDVTVQDILTGNEVTVLQNVTVPVAAVFCGIDLNVLSNILNNTSVTECKAASIPLVKKGYIKKH